MVSKIDICNYALQNLGSDVITSLTEGTPGAVECNLRYDQSRRTLLTMHQWNFATKRYKLNAKVAAPEFNYSYQYTLPSDFLYLVMTGLEEQYQQGQAQVFNSNIYVSDVPNYGGIDKYRIEQASDGDLVLLSNSNSVNIIYVADVTDTQKFSKTFVHLLARFLTANIAYRVTGSKSERDTQIQIFKEEFEDFISIDSQQGVFDRIEVSQFLSGML